MDTQPPIACTLSPPAFADREGAWRAALAKGLVSQERRPDGIRLRLHPAAEARIRDLVALEAECCEWLRGTVTPGEFVTVDLVAAGVGIVVLHAMFEAFAGGGCANRSRPRRLGADGTVGRTDQRWPNGESGLWRFRHVATWATVAATPTRPSSE
jgi:hypothetical protein